MTNEVKYDEDFNMRYEDFKKEVDKEIQKQVASDKGKLARQNQNELDELKSKISKSKLRINVLETISGNAMFIRENWEELSEDTRDSIIDLVEYLDVEDLKGILDGTTEDISQLITEGE